MEAMRVTLSLFKPSFSMDGASLLASEPASAS